MGFSDVSPMANLQADAHYLVPIYSLTRRYRLYRRTYYPKSHKHRRPGSWALCIVNNQCERRAWNCDSSVSSLDHGAERRGIVKSEWLITKVLFLASGLFLIWFGRLYNSVQCTEATPTSHSFSHRIWCFESLYMHHALRGLYLAITASPSTQWLGPSWVFARFFFRGQGLNLVFL